MKIGEAISKFRKSQYFWAVPVAFVLIFAGIIAIRSCKKEAEPTPEAVLEQESWYFPLGIQFAGEDAFVENEAEIILVYGKEKDGIYRNEKGACFLRSYNSLIDEKGPVYQKNGAMIAFSNVVDRYRVVYSDFSVEDGNAKMQYTIGAAFDAQNQKTNASKVFLLKLDQYGAFMNSEVIRIIRGETVNEIEPNSVLVFGSSYMAVYRFNGYALEKKVISVAGSTMLENAEFRVSYTDVLRFLTELETEEAPLPVNCGEELAGDYTFYEMDICFDIHGPSRIFQSADGVYLENETQYYTLHNAPLLETQQKYWWLPTDYELVSLNGLLYRRVPEKSSIRPAAEHMACIVVSGKEIFCSDCFFFDGKENYILTQDAEIVLADQTINVSAFSCVVVKDSQSFAIFDFENNTYAVYFIKGTNPVIAFPGFGDLEFMKHSFLHENGRTDYLLREPRVLKAVE